MKLGFIGFGGAGYGLAKGLKQAGLEEVHFHDRMQETAALCGGDTTACRRDRRHPGGDRPRASRARGDRDLLCHRRDGYRSGDVRQRLSSGPATSTWMSIPLRHKIKETVAGIVEKPGPLLSMPR